MPPYISFLICYYTNEGGVLRDLGSVLGVLAVLLVAMAPMLSIPRIETQNIGSGHGYSYTIENSYISRFTGIPITTTRPDGSTDVLYRIDYSPLSRYIFYAWTFFAVDLRNYISPPNSLIFYGYSSNITYQIEARLILGLNGSTLPQPFDGVVYGFEAWFRIWHNLTKHGVFFISIGLAPKNYQDRPDVELNIRFDAIPSNNTLLAGGLKMFVNNWSKFGVGLGDVVEPKPFYVDVGSWFSLRGVVILNYTAKKGLLIAEFNGSVASIAMTEIVPEYSLPTLSSDPPIGIYIFMIGATDLTPMDETPSLLTINMDDAGVFSGRGFFDPAAYTVTPTTTLPPPPQPPQPPTPTWTPTVITITVTTTRVIGGTTVIEPRYVTVTKELYYPSPLPPITITESRVVTSPMILTYEKRVTEAVATLTITQIVTRIIQQGAQQGGAVGITDQGLIIASVITAIAIIAATLLRRRR
jgi:hypothetical protein